MERQKNNGPQAISLLKQATQARPENAIMWNNLGAQYLEAKNYREAAPALDRAVTLQPGFAKAHLNLGNAYRGPQGVREGPGRIPEGSPALPQLRRCSVQPRHPLPGRGQDAQPGRDGEVQRSHRLLPALQADDGLAGQSMARDPADQYIAEAQEGIRKEQKRIERQKKAEERERQRTRPRPATPPAGAAPGSVPVGAPPRPRREERNETPRADGAACACWPRPLLAQPRTPPAPARPPAHPPRRRPRPHRPPAPPRRPRPARAATPTSRSSAGAGGKKIYKITTEIRIEGKIQKPEAFYVLQKSSINYEWTELKQEFLPKILESVQKAPF
jgi:hypothetical protein